MRRVRLALAVVTLAMSLILTLWAVLPGPQVQQVLQVPPDATNLNTAGVTLAEARRVTLAYPSRIPIGDFGVIKLTVAADSQSPANPTPRGPANQDAGPAPEGLSPSDTHVVIAEADADLPGLDLRPPGPVSEPLLRGISDTFVWSVHPTQPGTYYGTFWLFLVLVDKASQDQVRQAASAQSVQIRASTLLGLSGRAARATGALGVVIGAVLGIPFAGSATRWLSGSIFHRR